MLMQIGLLTYLKIKQSADFKRIIQLQVLFGD